MIYTDELRYAVNRGMVELNAQLNHLRYDHEDFDIVLSSAMILTDFNYEMVEEHDDRLMDEAVDVLSALGITVEG